MSGDIAAFSGTSGTLLQDTGTQLSVLAPLASPSFTGTGRHNHYEHDADRHHGVCEEPSLCHARRAGAQRNPDRADAHAGNELATTAFVKAQQIPISIGWIAGQNPNNAIASVINQGKVLITHAVLT